MQIGQIKLVFYTQEEVMQLFTIMTQKHLKKRELYQVGIPFLKKTLNNMDMLDQLVIFFQLYLRVSKH